MYSLDELRNTDPAIAQVIEDELARQNSHIAVSYTHLDVYKRQMYWMKRATSIQE